MTNTKTITNKKMRRVKKVAQVSKAVNYVVTVITGFTAFVVPFIMLWDYLTYDRMDWLGWTCVGVILLCVLTHYIEYKTINRYRNLRSIYKAQRER